MVYLAFDVSLNVEHPDLRDSDQLQIDIQQPIRLCKKKPHDELLEQKLEPDSIMNRGSMNHLRSKGFRFFYAFSKGLVI